MSGPVAGSPCDKSADVSQVMSASHRILARACALLRDCVSSGDEGFGSEHGLDRSNESALNP